MQIIVHTETDSLLFEKRPTYKYAIVKHGYYAPDNEWGITYYPDARPMQNEPKGTGKGNTIPILPSWWEYMQKINTPDGYSYNRSVGALWINIEYRDKDGNQIQTPRAESIHCGGNFIAYEEETATHVKLVSYAHDMNTTVLNPAVDNWHMKPWMFWKAVAVAAGGGKLINPNVHGRGIDVYFPLIRHTELWMNKNDLELFPAPPAGVRYNLRGVNVYDGDKPLMVNRVFYTTWFYLKTKGVIPPN